MNNANAFENSQEIRNPLDESNTGEPDEGQRQYHFTNEADINKSKGVEEEPQADPQYEDPGQFETLQEQEQEPVRTSKVKKIALGLIAALVVGGGAYTFYKVQSDAAAAKVVQEQEAKAATAAALQRATAAEAADKLAKEKKVQADKQAAQEAEAAKLEAERVAAENAKKTKVKAEAKANPKVVYPTLSAPAVHRSYQPVQQAPKQAWFTVNPS